MPKVAARRISARTLPSVWAELFLLLLIQDAILWDVGGDFLRFCQRAGPLVVIELLRGRVLLLQEHQLRMSPVAHLIARTTSSRNKRLLWPASAKETMASRCSCRSSVGLGALVGDSLTCGSDAIPVLLRPFSLIALRAILYLPAHQAIRAASAHSATGGMCSNAKLRGVRAVVQFLRQSAEPCAAPPTSLLMALLMEPRAVGAQARFPRCSSVCGCTVLLVLRSGPDLCWTKTLETRSLVCPVSYR